EATACRVFWDSVELSCDLAWNDMKAEKLAISTKIFIFNPPSVGQVIRRKNSNISMICQFYINKVPLIA
ncbi:hypothetical protein ABTE05_20460, partial [Acinetobacter baumannii]